MAAAPTLNMVYSRAPVHLPTLSAVQHGTRSFSILGGWLVSYLGVQVVGLLASIDQSTTALVASFLSFLAAVSVALINTRRRPDDEAVKTLIEALQDEHSERLKAEAKAAAKSVIEQTKEKSSEK